MTLPRILIVDDQYGADATQWAMLKRRLGLIEAGETPCADHLAETAICSGQRATPAGNRNDMDVVRDAVVSPGPDSWALILLDVAFESEGPGVGGDFGEEVRRRLLHEFPSLPIVMLTSRPQQELRDTEVPYLSKYRLDRRDIEKKMIRHGRTTGEQMRAILRLGDGLVAESPAMLSAFKGAFVHAEGSSPILLTGESGVGKEVMAQYIHKRSDRSEGPFIALNVAAIPKELVESELFGIEARVASSVAPRIGMFQAANGGTLFLDEIGDMPLDTQAKVLRALQENQILRIGGRTPVHIDVRVVSATNKNLPSMIRAEAFREDLLYRINAVTIDIPPLRERREDIVPLAAALLAKAARTEGKRGLSLSSDTLRLIEDHSYPGNVRELANLIARMVAAAGHDEIIDGTSLFVKTSTKEVGTKPEGREGGHAVADRLVAAPGKTAKISDLANLPAMLDRIRVDPEDESLRGIKTKLDSTYSRLLRRLAGAALQSCRNRVTGEWNKQAAMRLLTGNGELKGSDTKRILNALLERTQNKEIADDDLQILVDEWKESIDIPLRDYYSDPPGKADPSGGGNG